MINARKSGSQNNDIIKEELEILCTIETISVVMQLIFIL